MAQGTPDHDVGAGSTSAALLTELPIIAAGVGGGGGGTPKRIAPDAAGHRWVDFTTPAAKKWDVIGGYFQYATSAAAGNRVVIAKVSDENGDDVFHTVMDGHQATTTTESYELVRGGFYVPAAPGIAMPHLLGLPDGAAMGPGWVLEIIDTLATSAADVMSGGLWVVETDA